MMKSFFKKLASVLALAMVVSLAAPAAQTAQAAEAKKFTYHYSNGGSAVTTVNLAKTGDTVDLNFVGVKDYKDYKTLWVAGPGSEGFTVDQSGVITATADNGGGVVWLSVGDEQTYVSDPVKITIGEYKNVTIGSQDKSNRDLGAVELKVGGEPMDLAFFGILDWNLGKYTYKWVIEDPSILAVDQKTGEITPLKAGETTVTFMALNKYNYSNGITTKPLTVTVKPAKTTFVVDNGTTNVNTTEDDIDVYFSEKVTLDLEKGDVELYRVFEADDDNVASGLVTEYKNNYAYESKYITNISQDSKNDKKWTITPYEDLIDGETYEIRVKNLDPVQFTASVGAVAKVVVVEDVKAVLEDEFEAAVPAELSVKLYDAKGVFVNTAKYDNKENASEEYITFTIENDDTTGFDLTIDEILFYEDTTAKVVATYDNGKVTVASDVKNITPKKNNEYGIDKIVAWTIIDDTKDTKIDWMKTTQEMAANDTFRKLVVLFRDTRGQLYSTDYRGVNESYNKEPIELTITEAEPKFEELLYNAEETPFALNGCYVEFKAMDPDNLLIDVDGGIESFQKTNTRWGLYLYNYRIEEDQFDKEVFSATIKITAPRVMKKIDANSNNHSILLFTEKDYGQTENAYYSVFSTGSVHFDLYDQYGASWGVDGAGVGTTVEDPVFEVTNLTNHANAADLDDFFEAMEAELNRQRNDDTPYGDSTSNKIADASFSFELNDFLTGVAGDTDHDGVETVADQLIAGKTITFRVTETVSGVSEKIVIQILTPNYKEKIDDERVATNSAIVFEERIATGYFAEKYDIKEGGKISVTSEVSTPWGGVNTAGKTTANLTLWQKDGVLTNQHIGFENNIIISKVLPREDKDLRSYYINVEDLVMPTENFTTKADGSVTVDSNVLGTGIVTGSKILVVKMPNGSVLNLATDAKGNKNAAYSAKDAKVYTDVESGSAPATATGLGLSFKAVDTMSQDHALANDVFGDLATLGDTMYNQYQLNFAVIDQSVEDTKEIYFLPFGTYTAEIYTVVKLDTVNDRVILSGSGATFKQTSKLTFTDNMPEVTLKKRENATTSVYLGTIDPTLHNEEYVKQLIVDNFTFNWNGDVFKGHDKNTALETDDILCYTVQKSTNNQIVIKDVVFKVPVDWDGNKAWEDAWYRSTATVNLSLTYKEEY